MGFVGVRGVEQSSTALGFDPPLLAGNLNLGAEGLELVPAVELDLEQDGACLRLDMVEGLAQGFQEGEEQGQEEWSRPTEPMEMLQTGLNPCFPGLLRGHGLSALLDHKPQFLTVLRGLPPNGQQEEHQEDVQSSIGVPNLPRRIVGTVEVP